MLKISNSASSKTSLQLWLQPLECSSKLLANDVTLINENLLYPTHAIYKTLKIQSEKFHSYKWILVPYLIHFNFLMKSQLILISKGFNQDQTNHHPTNLNQIKRYTVNAIQCFIRFILNESMFICVAE